MRIHATHFLIALGGLCLGSCEDANRQDNLENVGEDGRRFPGNDNEPRGEFLDDEVATGSIDSYGRDSLSKEDDEDYDAIFRAESGDRDNPNFGEDARAGAAGAAGGTPDEANTNVTRNPSASTIERYDPQDIETSTAAGNGQASNSVGDEEVDSTPDRPYGNNMAYDRTPDNEQTDSTAGISQYSDQVRGGQQKAIGATGYANDELAEYYDSSEEDYTASLSNAEWGSWYRPMDPYEKGFNERTIQLGGALTDESVDAKYEKLKRRMYSQEKNQQALVYAPNDYTYSFVTNWDELALANAEQAALNPADDKAVDRAPTYGSGCESSDNPINCSTGELDKSLRRFLNDPKVLDDMLASGVESVTFEVDTAGRVNPRSVAAMRMGRECNTSECMRLSRSLGSALQRESWSPALRYGTKRTARIALDLKYQKNDEMTKKFNNTREASMSQ